MVMKSCLNGRERDAAQWAQFFAKSDSRFLFQGAMTSPGPRWSIIEAIWVDDSTKPGAEVR
jgi:hypothetical protein